ncbi:MAG: BolA family transcriptional regulator [Legionellales bacterium]|nr:BolA family transcriptional regulator [Legionellales bacterium]|tara:strand:- start:27 stop:260 length:234 start_codon:yes stop_codon:yes gene_type:complete
MKAVDIEARISAGLEGAQVSVETDDEHHYFVTVIWTGFEGMAPLARQRAVYATLGDAFATGAVHALALKTWTPDQAK